jgi:hypothetical protein
MNHSTPLPAIKQPLFQRYPPQGDTRAPTTTVPRSQADWIWPYSASSRGFLSGRQSMIQLCSSRAADLILVREDEDRSARLHRDASPGRADQPKSNSKNSASVSALMAIAGPSSTAAPSPSPISTPLTVKMPRASCNQRRPDRSVTPARTFSSEPRLSFYSHRESPSEGV